MKHLILTLVAFMAAVASLSAGSKTYIKQHYKCDDFRGISASGIVEVKLKNSHSFSVDVTCPELLKDYISVKVSKGRLYIGTERIPAKLNREISNKKIIAEVSMPAITYIGLSGASSLSSDDIFNLENQELNIDVSGAARIGCLRIRGGSLDAEVSGAAQCSIAGDLRTASVEASGAPRFTLTGKVDKLEIEASGASKINAFEADCEVVDVELSGASHTSVSASKSITLELSGASSVRYSGPSDLSVRTESISRSSSVTRVK